MFPSLHLLVQIKQWKNVWNLFQINDKENRTTHVTTDVFVGIFIVNYEHISHFVQVFPLLTLNKLMSTPMTLTCFIERSNAGQL